MSARLSVSTWSLHPVLGNPPFWGVGEQPCGETSGGISLLELLPRIAEFGIGTLEVTHFHLPSLEAAYLKDLRVKLDQSGLELWSFLIDDGDVTGPDAERDEAWIASLLPVAQQLGARCVRVIAGKAQPAPEALARSRAALERLAGAAAGCDLRLLTENWFDLLSTPDAVRTVLDGTGAELNFDFGNWSGPNKYEALREIAPLAVGSHAKAHFEDDVIDAADFEQCLQLLKNADFGGPYSLVCDGAADRWRGLADMKQIAGRYL